MAAKEVVFPAPATPCSPKNLIRAGENRFDGLALPRTEVLEMVMRRRERSGLPLPRLHPANVAFFKRHHFWRCKRSAQ